MSDRVLLLTKGLGRGGAERILASSVPYLDKRRFAYEVGYVLASQDALVPEFEEAGLPVTCLGGAWRTDWQRRLHRMVRERKVGLIHAHSPLAAVAARLATRWSSVPVVYTEHNVWQSYHKATYWANLLTYPWNDHVFAVSDAVRRSIAFPRALKTLSMPRIETLYHGIDPASTARWGSSEGVREELGIPQGAPTVGMIGSFKPQKNHRNMLRAMTLVRRAVPDARLVLVGNGPLEGEIRREARSLGLDGSVVFAGLREDAPRVAGALDVFVLSSEHEGLSIALLEAMALERPVVVTAVGGLPEVVEHGRQGLVVPPGDAGALAEAVTTLLRDPQLRNRLGAEAGRRAADFDIERAVSRVEQVYDELLARPGRKRSSRDRERG